LWDRRNGFRGAKSAVIQVSRDIKISITIVLAAELFLAALIGIPLVLLLVLDLKVAYAAHAKTREKLRLTRAEDQARPAPH
jgi:hypothetical protein